jgi:hypothetical protein
MEYIPIMSDVRARHFPGFPIAQLGVIPGVIIGVHLGPLLFGFDHKIACVFRCFRHGEQSNQYQEKGFHRHGRRNQSSRDRMGEMMESRGELLRMSGRLWLKMEEGFHGMNGTGTGRDPSARCFRVLVWVIHSPHRQYDAYN